MSDPRYQRHTAAIHLILAFVSLTGAIVMWWIASYSSIAGLVLSTLTNFLIGIEKLDLIHRGKA